MTAYRRGDMLLVGFMFSDESGVKHRPALVLSSRAYHQGRQELIVAAVTSNIGRVLYGDHLLAGWKEAGLLFPSTVTGILRTIKAQMIYRRLGSLLASEMKAIDINLGEILGLKTRAAG